LTQSRAELAAFVKARGNHPSSDQKLEIMKRREKLAKQLEDFSEAGQGNFPNLDLREGTIHDPPLSEEILDDDGGLYLKPQIPCGLQVDSRWIPGVQVDF
jgi:hypothetical protein